MSDPINTQAPSTTTAPAPAEPQYEVRKAELAHPPSGDGVTNSVTGTGGYTKAPEAGPQDNTQTTTSNSGQGVTHAVTGPAYSPVAPEAGGPNATSTQTGNPGARSSDLRNEVSPSTDPRRPLQRSDDRDAAMGRSNSIDVSIPSSALDSLKNISMHNTLDTPFGGCNPGNNAAQIGGKSTDISRFG